MSIRKKLTTLALIGIGVIGLAGCSASKYHHKATIYNKPYPKYPKSEVTLSSPLPPEFWDWTQEERIEYIKVAPKIKKKAYPPIHIR